MPARVEIKYIKVIASSGLYAPSDATLSSFVILVETFFFIRGRLSVL